MNDLETIQKNNSYLTQSIIPKVSRETFNNDVNNCLTIIQTLTKDDKYQYYKVEYISIALYKKIIVIGVYD